MPSSPPVASTDTQSDGRRHVNVVSRALRVLQALNNTTAGTVSSIAAETGLPRGTAFRILETFVRDGFAVKNPQNFEYCVSHRVVALSQGYVHARWVEKARPFIHGLGKEILWPVNIATAAGSYLEVRCATDFESPLVHERVSSGQRFPMIALGQPPSIHLAFLTPEEREPRLRHLFEELGLTGDYSEWRRGIMKQLAGLREDGFQHVRSGPACSMHVPLVVNGAAMGILTAWYYRRSLSLEAAEQTILSVFLKARPQLETLIAQAI